MSAQIQKIIQNPLEYKKLTQEERLYAVVDEALAYGHPVEEIESPLLDIRKQNMVGMVLDPELPNPYAREIMLNHLRDAVGYFHVRGYSLCIRELFRPIKQQQIEFDAIYTEFRKKHPEISEDALYDEVTKYIADPRLAPPHSTGGAVDIYLTTSSGEILDMGTSINTADISAAWSTIFSKEIQSNRELLLSGMLFAGFAPLATEWWHFSYGDRLWGMYYDRPAIFDVCNLRKK